MGRESEYLLVVNVLEVVVVVVVVANGTGGVALSLGDGSDTLAMAVCTPMKGRFVVPSPRSTTITVTKARNTNLLRDILKLNNQIKPPSTLKILLRRALKIHFYVWEASSASIPFG